MLYRILLNFCVWQETILHNMTTLSESKSVKNVGIIHERPFLHRLFLWKLIEFLIIAHVSSTIDSWCFIGSVVTFAFNKRTYCTTWKTLTELKLVQKCRSYLRATLSSSAFFMKIDGIFKNCSCFIDYRLLMLYRILLTFAFDKRPYCTTWLRCQNQNLFKNVGIIHERPFLYRHFLWKLIEFLIIAHVSSTIDSWCFIGSVLTFAFNKRTYCTTKKSWQN